MYLYLKCTYIYIYIYTHIYIYTYTCVCEFAGSCPIRRLSSGAGHGAQAALCPEGRAWSNIACWEIPRFNGGFSLGNSSIFLEGSCLFMGFK